MAIAPQQLAPIFDEIYATDLVYQSHCWKLCGDAHCCNFARHKAKFKLLARSASQELPLLPGEFGFLQANGWLSQFHTFEHKSIRYEYGNGAIGLETIVSQRPGCACDHATRTTICRLYPLLPVFDLSGALRGTEPLGIYEELERIEGLEPACRLDKIAIEQLNPFLKICGLLASNPVLLFHMIAYRAAKQHIASRLAERKAASDKPVFTLFEAALLRRRLIDDALLKPQLAHMHAAFEMKYGATFTEGMAALNAPPYAGIAVAESVTSASRS